MALKPGTTSAESCQLLLKEAHLGTSDLDRASDGATVTCAVIE